MSDIKKEKIKNKRKFFSLDEKFGDFLSWKTEQFYISLIIISIFILEKEMKKWKYSENKITGNYISYEE